MTDEIEQKVLDAVERVSPDHDVIRIDPDFAATAEFCAKYGYSQEESVNCIVVVGKSEPPVYAACLVQATRRLDVNGTIRRRLGTRKASFAPAETTVELTGMLPDGVTPFGLPEDLPIWIDAPVQPAPGHRRWGEPRPEALRSARHARGITGGGVRRGS